MKPSGDNKKSERKKQVAVTVKTVQELEQELGQQLAETGSAGSAEPAGNCADSGGLLASKRGRLWLKAALLAFLMMVVALVGATIAIVKPVIDATPELAGDIRPAVSTRIFAADGSLLLNVHATENRLPATIEQIPLDLQRAFVAAEDARFYQHNGVDIKAIARALWRNFHEGEVAEGGSTLTQQLAKNALLSQERTWKRKIQEAVLALELERRYSKDKIMEMYLNQIYFGAGAYGVQTAAQIYFGKNVQDLNLAECALLAGIPKRPNDYSPFNNLRAAKERQEIVLTQMVKYKFIERLTAEQALNAELKLVTHTEPEQQAAYFVDYVLQQLIDRYGAEMVYKEGLQVYTTLDREMQAAAEQAVAAYLPGYFTDDKGLQQPQGALVALNPQTGCIYAMVGGRGGDHFNRAVQAERQPGSAFKPFVYLAALAGGVSPEAVLEDRPTSFGSYTPRNYDGGFRGLVTVRSALEQSLNVIAVRLANHIGADKVLQYAQQMGISTLVFDGDSNDRNLAMALGGLTKGVSPLEIAAAYGVLANDGVRVEPTGIVKVVDRNGKVIYQYQPQGQQVVEADLVRTLVDMMQGVLLRGTGTRAGLDRPAAGKTGTTSDYQDAWFVGFTPNLAASVWLGCDNNESLHGVTGGDLPAVIWHQFMQTATAKLPVAAFAVPVGGSYRAVVVSDGVKMANVQAEAAGAEVYFDAGELKNTSETRSAAQTGTESGRLAEGGIPVVLPEKPVLNDKDRPLEKPLVAEPAANVPTRPAESRAGRPAAP